MSEEIRDELMNCNRKSSFFLAQALLPLASLDAAERIGCRTADIEREK